MHIAGYVGKRVGYIQESMVSNGVDTVKLGVHCKITQRELKSLTRVVESEFVRRNGRGVVFKLDIQRYIENWGEYLGEYGCYQMQTEYLEQQLRKSMKVGDWRGGEIKKEIQTLQGYVERTRVLQYLNKYVLLCYKYIQGEVEERELLGYLESQKCFAA